MNLQPWCFHGIMGIKFYEFMATVFHGIIPWDYGHNTFNVAMVFHGLIPWDSGLLVL